MMGILTSTTATSELPEITHPFRHDPVTETPTMSDIAIDHHLSTLLKEENIVFQPPDAFNVSFEKDTVSPNAKTLKLVACGYLRAIGSGYDDVGNMSKRKAHRFDLYDISQIITNYLLMQQICNVKCARRHNSYGLLLFNYNLNSKHHHCTQLPTCASQKRKHIIQQICCQFTDNKCNYHNECSYSIVFGVLAMTRGIKTQYSINNYKYNINKLDKPIPFTIDTLCNKWKNLKNITKYNDSINFSTFFCWDLCNNTSSFEGYSKGYNYSCPNYLRNSYISCNFFAWRYNCLINSNNQTDGTNYDFYSDSKFDDKYCLKFKNKDCLKLNFEKIYDNHGDGDQLAQCWLYFTKNDEAQPIGIDFDKNVFVKMMGETYGQNNDSLKDYRQRANQIENGKLKLNKDYDYCPVLSLQSCDCQNGGFFYTLTTSVFKK